jgi:thioredoxin reductase
MLPSTLLKLYDVLIIGSGPAGLSAALACGRQFRQTLVLSASTTQPFRNTAADHMHNVLGFDHVPPEEFRRTAKGQMVARYADYVGFDDQAEVVAVEKVEEAIEGHQGVFKVRDIEGRQWMGRKLVLATGSRDVFPDIKGFDEVWGSGV